jgi:hypothetical protein
VDRFFLVSLSLVAIMLFNTVFTVLSLSASTFGRSLPYKTVRRQEEEAIDPALICGELIDAVNEGESNVSSPVSF